MGLVLDHVRLTPSGSYEYRRRVPKDVAEVINKREFKKVLGATKAEALHQYAHFHNAVEREIASARRQAVRRNAAHQGALGGLALRKIVEERVAALLAGSIDQDAVRDIIAEELLAGYPRSLHKGDYEGDPVGVPEIDRLTVQLLRNPDAPRPPPTLHDAYELYIKDKLDPEKEDEHRKATQHLDRVFDIVKEALGGLPELSKLRREDARKVRDLMLVQRKPNGQLIAPVSVQRNLTVVRSVVNHALREFDLRGTVANPFAELPVKGAEGGRGNETSEADKRLPLPFEVRKAIRDRLEHAANRELGLIWRLLEGTGCRVAEVTGLRVSDVTTEGE